MTSEVISYAAVAAGGFIFGAVFKKAVRAFKKLCKKVYRKIYRIKEKLKMTDKRRRILRYCLACGGWPFVVKVELEKRKTKRDAFSIIKSRYRELKGRDFEKLIALDYHERSGRVLHDIKHPRTFNEKIQWLKAYDSTPLKTRLADKYLARGWVAEKIGEEHLVPLLGVYERFDDIDFSVLPEQFVLKANHGSGWNVIVRNKSEWLLDRTGGGG